MTTHALLLLPHHAFDVNRMAVEGQRTPDGAIYAGISPDTGLPMYTTPTDSLCASWHSAIAYAAKLDTHGRKDWRVPTDSELAVLFKNRAAIGNFDCTGHPETGWYWSSSHISICNAWTQRFRDGRQTFIRKHNASAVRCVRG